MRGICERKNRTRRLLLISIGAALCALFLYCVPWWVFLLIGVVSLLTAGWTLLRE